jgi:hypothetical protein
MKTIRPAKSNRRIINLAMAVVLLCAASAAMAQQPRIINRPLTPDDVVQYKLPEGTQESGGLMTVGVGTAVYLEAQVLKGTPVVGITWAVTAKPTNSAADLTAGPLGAEVPSFEPKDREEFGVAGRQLLIPDKKGQYTITASVNTGTNTISLTNVITAANYVGVGFVDGNNEASGRQCAGCHDGGLTPDKVTPWSQTGHASMFTKAIDGLMSNHYSSNCISCHTLGYNTASTAVNGGFDDVAAQLGWTFPTNLVAGNWAALPMGLKQVANIQCESCHGPGSEHGGNKAKTSVSFSAGNCSSCHSEEPYHFKPQEWFGSKHAVAVREESASCAGCHSGIGFIDRIEGAATIRTNYAAITCATCHDPHSVATPHQLRGQGNVTLMDTSRPGGATVISNGGRGQLCMECHMSRRDAVSYVKTTKGSNRFGPHHGPQADMLAGVNAITYGLTIPSSGHGQVVTNTCVNCHMQTVGATDAAFAHAGGHTFNMAFETETNEIQMVAACQSCHGTAVTSFDIPKIDYDGDGVVKGVQTEVMGLVKQLSVLLPPVGVEKTTVEDVGKYCTTNYTQAELNATYNLLFVLEDKSSGIHNTAYTVGLLKASINDLKGGAVVIPPVPTVAQVNTVLSNYFANSTDYVTSPDVLGNNKFQLSVDNLIGWNLLVQASSDLVTWTNLPTATIPMYQFVDPDAGKSQQRFYRLRYPPVGAGN